MSTPPDKPIPRTSFDEPTAESADASGSIAVSRFDKAYTVGHVHRGTSTVLSRTS